MQFTKKNSGGGRVIELEGDALISHTTHKTARNGQLCVRLRRVALAKCGLRLGDRAIVELVRDGNCGTLTVTRSDDRRKAFAISGKKGERSGLIKITLDDSQFGYVWPDGKTGTHVCTMVESDRGRAEFLVDFEEA